MQGSRLEINDQLDLAHQVLFERIGSSTKRFVSAVQSAKRSVSGSLISVEDLSAAFSRICIITASGANTYSNSTETELLYHGFITDTHGMQDNDPDTDGINLIW